MSGAGSLFGWWESLGRPLRRLPRWAAALALLATLATCVWAAKAEESYGRAAEVANRQKLDKGARRDFDLYLAIDRRLAAGENYYAAALDEHRTSRFPTTPFVTVRPPTLALSSVVLGLPGLRILAAMLWAVTAIGIYMALAGKVRRPEQFGATATTLAVGAVALIEKVGLSQEIMAGLFISASLATYRPRLWWPSFLLACMGLAVRELALPYLLLWGALAALHRRWAEVYAVLAAVALFAIGMALHAQAVIAHRLPGDIVSSGWGAIQGPDLPLHGLVLVTMFNALPDWIGAPLVVLTLLGWAGLGGRLGLTATLWFAGFAVMCALFARIDNFYWLALLVPAFGAGLALAPRALGDLVAVTLGRRDQPRGAAEPGSP
ncbi:hypothetical protein [Tsuneonella sp. HG222]